MPTTTDRTFDRVPHLDPRSRAYPVRTATLAARAPRSYTWRLVPEQRVLDQGAEGHCVGFGCAHELAAKPKVVRELTDDDAHTLFYEARDIDRTRHDLHFDDGATVLAGVKALVDRGHYRGYRWAFGLDDVVLALGYAGPVVLGVDWYEGMLDPDDEGYLRRSGAKVGGHCLLACGVSVPRREVLLLNSWGEGWSDVSWQSRANQRWRGYARLTFEDLAALLRDAGEACVPLRAATRFRRPEG